uniref:IS1-like element transposase n=1 Tax=Xenorhabdus bovienii TaxID=40576 RepID=UPI0022A8717D
MAGILVIVAILAVKFFSWNTLIKGVKEQIVDIAMNNGGIRDTARILRVATATVMKTLKSMVSPVFATLILTHVGLPKSI